MNVCVYMYNNLEVVSIISIELATHIPIIIFDLR